MVDKLRSLLRRSNAAIMAILNVTPDSFSDGGRFNGLESALKQAERLISEGADILDIGGESTRPGAQAVSVDEELSRVVPVIEALYSRFDVPISIDTSKAQVMRAAIDAGACMVNDVNALQAVSALEVVATAQVPVCLMHMAGNPRTMQASPRFDDVYQQVASFLKQRAQACVDAGIRQADILVDPGIGFGKNLRHNLVLLNNLQGLKEDVGCEVLIGISRKSMIDQLLQRPIDQRVYASVGLAVQAVLNGAKVVRVHDVAASYDAIRCVEAVQAS